MFHVHSLLLSHSNHNAVAELFKKLDAIHGTYGPLTVTRGQLHELMGISLYVSSIEQDFISTQNDFVKKVYQKKYREP